MYEDMWKGGCSNVPVTKAAVYSDTFIHRHIENFLLVASGQRPVKFAFLFDILNGIGAFLSIVTESITRRIEAVSTYSSWNGRTTWSEKGLKDSKEEEEEEEEGIFRQGKSQVANLPLAFSIHFNRSTSPREIEKMKI
ncbi:hypothetical protein RUM44_004844 [Polyplax serrata]|uniref:Uncharacterized protein n=1 Tax=Polyplax serrata TaxID=468196 RepID=A0ABR1B401_POLSC